ncbi:hypothetical protein ABZ697_27670 [Streptomyces albidoflavus]|uniref:hypothetical protein n=1 Tax=Streptomyces albidoflavus TaxID=1886 RepID=UPI00340215DD
MTFFDPEMTGGLQLDLFDEEPEEPSADTRPSTAVPPAVVSPQPCEQGEAPQ